MADDITHDGQIRERLVETKQRWARDGRMAVREVATAERTDGRAPTRVLGGLALSQQRGPVAGGALWVGCSVLDRNDIRSRKTTTRGVISSALCRGAVIAQARDTPRLARHPALRAGSLEMNPSN